MQKLTAGGHNPSYLLKYLKTQKLRIADLPDLSGGTPPISRAYFERGFGKQGAACAV